MDFHSFVVDPFKPWYFCLWDAFNSLFISHHMTHINDISRVSVSRDLYDKQSWIILSLSALCMLKLQSSWDVLLPAELREETSQPFLKNTFLPIFTPKALEIRPPRGPQKGRGRGGPRMSIFYKSWDVRSLAKPDWAP